MKKDDQMVNFVVTVWITVCTVVGFTNLAPDLAVIFCQRFIFGADPKQFPPTLSVFVFFRHYKIAVEIFVSNNLRNKGERPCSHLIPRGGSDPAVKEDLIQCRVHTGS